MNVKIDSRKIEKGDTFVALRGIDHDGHAYIRQAIENGAAKIICEEGSYEVETCIVEDTRAYLVNYLKDTYYDKISKLKLIGITGTNGKTTSAFLLHQMLNKLGRKCGYIGTIGFYVGEKIRSLANTTPDIYDLYAILLQCLSLGCEYVVMEVSSQGLANHRVETLQFDYAVFTNLTQDHLDFHKTMERYALAKQELFRMLKPSGKAIINYDDSYKHYFLLEENENVTFGFTGGDFKVALDAADKEHTEFSVQCPAFTQNFSTNLIGTYNIYNLMASVVILTLEQFDSATIAQAAAALTLPKGRTECIHTGNNLIMVDYAHTPDAMSKVLTAARALTSGSIYVVFGCTGERDRDKRAKMSAIACKHADYVIMTHDDPHYEDQAQIYHDMTSGLSYDNYEIVHDRKDAIRKGISLLDTDDILLILGKGHEEFIVCRDKRIPFNDMNVARQCLSERRTPTETKNRLASYFKLSFDGNEFLLFHLWLCFLLWNRDLQDTIFEFCLDIILCDRIAHIEGSVAGTFITFLTDIFALGILLILRVLCRSLDDQVTILHFTGYIFLLKSWKVHINLVTVFFLKHISTHQILCRCIILIDTKTWCIKEIIHKTICK